MLTSSPVSYIPTDQATLFYTDFLRYPYADIFWLWQYLSYLWGLCLTALCVGFQDCLGTENTSHQIKAYRETPSITSHWPGVRHNLRFRTEAPCFLAALNEQNPRNGWTIVHLFGGNKLHDWILELSGKDETTKPRKKCCLSIWVFPKIGRYPQIIHFYRGFHYEPSISGVFPLFLETPIYSPWERSHIPYQPALLSPWFETFSPDKVRHLYNLYLLHLGVPAISAMTLLYDCILYIYIIMTFMTIDYWIIHQPHVWWRVWPERYIHHISATTIQDLWNDWLKNQWNFFNSC